MELSQAPTWAALPQASCGSKSIYEGPSVDKDLKGSMNPGAASDIGHWRRWAERSDGRSSSSRALATERQWCEPLRRGGKLWPHDAFDSNEM